MGTSGRNVMLKLLPRDVAQPADFFFKMLYFGGKLWRVLQGRNETC